jgi:hypothetical protein
MGRPRYEGGFFIVYSNANPLDKQLAPEYPHLAKSSNYLPGRIPAILFISKEAR